MKKPAKRSAGLTARQRADVRAIIREELAAIPIVAASAQRAMIVKTVRDATDRLIAGIPHMMRDIRARGV